MWPLWRVQFSTLASKGGDRHDTARVVNIAQSQPFARWNFYFFRVNSFGDASLMWQTLDLCFSGIDADLWGSAIYSVSLLVCLLLLMCAACELLLRERCELLSILCWLTGKPAGNVSIENSNLELKKWHECSRSSTYPWHAWQVEESDKSHFPYETVDVLAFVTKAFSSFCDVSNVHRIPYLHPTEQYNTYAR